MWVNFLGWPSVDGPTTLRSVEPRARRLCIKPTRRAPPELLTRHGSLGLRGVRHECESDRRTDDLGSGARIREVSASRHARRARHRRRAAIARSHSASIGGTGERRAARRRRARRGASASETTHSAELSSHRLSRQDVWFARRAPARLPAVCTRLPRRGDSAGSFASPSARELCLRDNIG